MVTTVPGQLFPTGGRLVRERIVRRLLGTLQRDQGAADAFLRSAGYPGGLATFLESNLADLSEDRLWMMASQASVALSNVDARTAGRQPFRGSDWRLLFYCLVGSRSLQEGIHRLEDLFTSVDGRFGEIRQSFRDDQAVIHLSGKRGSDPDTAFIVALDGLAMFHNILSWMIGRPLGEHVELDFPEGFRRLADEALLPFELVLDCASPALVFNPALLGAPILRTIEDCERLPRLNLAMHLAGEGQAAQVLVRVRQLLYAELQRNHTLPVLDDVAAALGMSRAAIRRQIRREGSTFRTLREDVRRALAITLLSDPQISIEDVAARLDFCDSDALRAATHKWVGMAPSDYRHLLRSTASDG